jgi:hypothetical protein
MKPYNFLLTAYVQRFGHPEGVDPAYFHLIAPFESDPRRWAKLPWTNLYGEPGEQYHLSTRSSVDAVPGVVQVKTYRHVLDDYRRHPETKSLAPDGTVCRGSTIGLLRRRPVTALFLTHMGKESNRLEEVEAGLVHDPEELYTEYEDSQHGPWQAQVLPVLKRMPRAMLAERTGLSGRAITALRNGQALPHPTHRELLTRVAADFARAQLQALGATVAAGDLEICATLLASMR